MSDTHETRLERARLALEGLSVGDAFGETFFSNPDVVEGLIAQRALAAPPWRWTDDTAMALSIYRELRLRGGIDPDELATDFARRYEPGRGYGPAMHGMLREIRDDNGYWREIAGSLFHGQGSYGNGAAMRVAPLGAYLADDPAGLVAQAARSSEVTHAHPDGIAGGVAVAVAAGLAWRCREEGRRPARNEFLDAVLAHVPDGQTRAMLRRARDLPSDCSVRLAAAALGNGTMVSAQDTVPLALWCAAGWLDDYEEAMWQTVSALGDRDTTCAIAGGVVAVYVGAEGIPAGWRESREPLPAWAFEDVTEDEP
jgi:ADP-ribosylglycohydrolase